MKADWPISFCSVPYCLPSKRLSKITGQSFSRRVSAVRTRDGRSKGLWKASQLSKRLGGLSRGNISQGLEERGPATCSREAAGQRLSQATVTHHRTCACTGRPPWRHSGATWVVDGVRERRRAATDALCYCTCAGSTAWAQTAFLINQSFIWDSPHPMQSNPSAIAPAGLGDYSPRSC